MDDMPSNQTIVFNMTNLDMIFVSGSNKVSQKLIQKPEIETILWHIAFLQIIKIYIYSLDLETFSINYLRFMEKFTFITLPND